MKKCSLPLVMLLLLTACAPSKKTPSVTSNSSGNRPATTTTPKTVEKPKVESPTTATDANMASISGKWRLESSTEKDLSKMTGAAMPELYFNETDRKVSGYTGCNNLNGFFFTSGNQFNFSPIAIEKKRCADPTVEKYIKGFLKNVGFYKTEGSKLFFYSKTDKDRYVVFVRK